MLILAIALAMTTLPAPATPDDPAVFVLINAEKASGFKTMAECEQAISGPDERQGKALAEKRRSARGSVFNRNAGNTTRCEIVQGEPLVVVYPKGHEAEPATR